jgi:hypothetical protein
LAEISAGNYKRLGRQMTARSPVNLDQAFGSPQPKAVLKSPGINGAATCPPPFAGIVPIIGGESGLVKKPESIPSYSFIMLSSFFHID